MSATEATATAPVVEKVEAPAPVETKTEEIKAAVSLLSLVQPLAWSRDSNRANLFLTSFVGARC